MYNILTLYSLISSVFSGTWNDLSINEITFAFVCSPLRPWLLTRMDTPPLGLRPPRKPFFYFRRVHGDGVALGCTESLADRLKFWKVLSDGRESQLVGWMFGS